MRKSLHKCICGHEKEKHHARLGLRDRSANICWGCNELYDWDDREKWYHPFKLDNLRLVEELATQKGLI